VAAPVFSRIFERATSGPCRHYVAGDGSEERHLAAARDEAPAGGGVASASYRRPRVSAPLFESAYASAGTWVDTVSPAGACERSAASEKTLRGGIVSLPAEVSETVSVPDVRGMSIRNARREASNLGLVLSFDGSGRVRTQSPRPGASVASGSKVIVSCSP